ncbi:hypothetical protein BH10ACT3_BH10ACT3_11940 [soil metagenome]
MHTTTRLCAVMTLVVLLATSCLSGDIDVTVRDDGSGEIELEVFPSPQLQTVLDAVDVDTLADTFLDDIDGSEFERIERDGQSGYRVLVPFDDYAQLTTFLVDGVTVAGQQVRLFSSIDLQELENGWRLDAVLAPELTSNALTAPPGLDELLETDGRAVFGTTLNLSISLPGTVVNTNADERDGGTATWRLKELEGETQLSMQNGPKEFPTTPQIVLMAAGAMVLLGLIFAMIGAGRSKRSTKRRELKFPGSSVSDVGWQRPEGTTGALVSPLPTASPPMPERVLPTIDMTPVAATPVAHPVAQAPVGEVGSLYDQNVDESVDRNDSAGERGTAAVAEEPTMSMAIPAGWYADPGDPTRSRWWDGQSWTEHLS